MLRAFILLVSHGMAIVAGFALGVYALPILTAPPAPEAAAIEQAAAEATYRGSFDRNLAGSDLLHWGEGDVMLSSSRIVHKGRLSPGPDYKLYLAPRFVDTKEAFLEIKAASMRIADVKTFDGFIVEVPAGVDVAAYEAVVVWCEAFSQFISAAKFR